MNRQSLELLLSRLTWPSGMVRERTSVALAELLNGPDSSAAKAALFDWIAGQTLESVVALGLLPFCHAKDIYSDFEVPDTSLMAAIRRPSLLSNLLLQDLGIQTTALASVNTLQSGRAPNGFRPRSFFEQNASAFLAPIFSRHSKNVERTALIPFGRQWAFEWETLLEIEGMTPSTNPLWLQGKQDGEHLPIFDTKLSEIYRSAYLRALAWALSTGRIPLQVVLSLAAETCPIDLDLWKMKPGRRPAWWPSVQESEASVDTTPGRIWAAVTRLWEEPCFEDNGSALLAAGGHVYEDREAAYELEISGIFQKAVGPMAGEPKAIFEECRPSLRASKDLIRYRGSLQSVPAGELETCSGDWSVVPASGYVIAPTNCRWQYWRMFRLLLPAPFLSEPSFAFRCSDDAVEVSNETGVKAWLRDWTDGLREKRLANLEPRSGYVLTADADMVHGFAARTGSTFSWACRLTAYQRRYEYGSFETATFYTAFGTSGIIIPR